MLGADADGVLLVRRGDVTTQMTCYRLSHIFDTDNPINPLQPLDNISALGRIFAKLQINLQHQHIFFLVTFNVQRFHLYTIE